MVNGVIAMLQRTPARHWDETLTKVELSDAQRAVIEEWRAARSRATTAAASETNDAAVDKVRENKVRRAAARQGLKVMKSRARDSRALDFGCYALTDAATNVIVAGVAMGRLAFNLDDIEEYVYGMPPAED